MSDTAHPQYALSSQAAPQSDSQGRATFTASGSPRPMRRTSCSSPVRLVLVPQYPGLGYVERRPTCVGVHRRPPGIPVHVLRVGCPPWPCGRLSRPRTTRGLRPNPDSSVDDGPAARPGWAAGGRPRMVPTFTMHRSTGEVPSFAPAASPHLRRRPSLASPPAFGTGFGVATHKWWSCTADRPTSTRLEPAAHYGALPAGSNLFTPSHHACRTRTVWRCRPVPALSGLLRPSPASPGWGSPSFKGLLRQANGGVLSPPPGTRRLVAHPNGTTDDDTKQQHPAPEQHLLSRSRSEVRRFLFRSVRDTDSIAQSAAREWDDASVSVNGGASA